LALSCPCYIASKFLLEAIYANSLGPFLFQAHLKLVWERLPLGVVPCVPLFEQLAKRGIDCLKENISKRLHDHSFTNIISNLPSNSHWACLKSCAGLSVGTWLLTRPIITFSCVTLDVFSTVLRTRLGFSLPLVLKVSHYICNPHGDPLFSLRSWWGEDGLTWCCARCFRGHCKRYEISCIGKAYPCSFAFCPVIFAPLSRHCAINWWCPHVGKHYHHQPHLSWFGFTYYSFL